MIKNNFSSITSIIKDAKKGRMFILVDDKDRENEGDLVIPGSKCKSSSINFMAKHGRGLICLALSKKQIDLINGTIIVGFNDTDKKKKSNSKKKAVENIFEYLGIIKRKNHYPSQLSGGEKARVCLSRAIVNRPVILFADEPTGNLDKKNSEKLISLFQKINSDFNQTIILTTHNKEVADFGNKKLKLEDGVLT